jgi:phage terminase large subunit
MKLANRFYLTYLWVEKGKYQNPDDIISLSSDIPLLDKLRTECCRIPTIPNGAGKIQLMSKEDMKKKYDLDSPGMADCLAMGEEVPDLIEDDEPLVFTQYG